MPRLSIVHLVLWMTTSAILFARSISEFGGMSAGEVVVSLTIGASFTAALVTVYSFGRVWGYGWEDTEPGHWFNFVAVWEYAHQCAYDTEIDRNWFAFAGIVVLFLLGLRAENWPRYWKVTFLLYATAAMVSLIWCVANDFGGTALTDLLARLSSIVFRIIALLFLIAAVSLDLRNGVYRDWIHWTGIAYASLTWYGLIAAYVIPPFFFPVANR